MTKLGKLLLLLGLVISTQSVANTVCDSLAQCQQVIQQNLYQHWKARYNYPGATVVLMVRNDLQGNIDVAIEKSSGFDPFDQSAVDAITQSLKQLAPRNLSEEDMAKLKVFKLNLSAE
ncbi:TonB C-terminal domain-containing protein [Motilimonas eburnea]|uniref:TonB C-terminal domain-containing protein n=1 Tax=Motilimonas eburnea TaxID=1737488 RepID=UPI001E4972FF|nr:TonB C-terminal domain-containing protein [Motilimonas eburnea]MCE2572694.1 TonB C-terminal domain-containing protein [Motilimonas eburnea]